MSLSPINSMWDSMFSLSKTDFLTDSMHLGEHSSFNHLAQTSSFLKNHGKVLVVCPPRWYNSKTKGKGGDRSRRNKNPLISGVT